MSPEDQRIAILTHLGWTELSRHGRRGDTGAAGALRGISPDGKTNQIPPNHLVNLNVMSEAERHAESWGFNLEYLAQLQRVCNQPYPVNATAANRAEAFLKVLNLWTISSNE